MGGLWLLSHRHPSLTFLHRLSLPHVYEQPRNRQSALSRKVLTKMKSASFLTVLVLGLSATMSVTQALVGGMSNTRVGHIEETPSLEALVPVETSRAIEDVHGNPVAVDMKANAVGDTDKEPKNPCVKPLPRCKALYTDRKSVV